MGNFRFKLSERVKTKLGDLTGEIIARSEYAYDTPPQYQVLHVASGEPKETWFREDLLAAA